MSAAKSGITTAGRKNNSRVPPTRLSSPPVSALASKVASASWMLSATGWTRAMRKGQTPRKAEACPLDLKDMSFRGTSYFCPVCGGVRSHDLHCSIGGVREVPERCRATKVGEYDDLRCCDFEGHSGEHIYVVDDESI